MRRSQALRCQCDCSVREMLAVLQPDPGRPTSLTRKLNKGPYCRIDTVRNERSPQARAVQHIGAKLPRKSSDTVTVRAMVTFRSQGSPFWGPSLTAAVARQRDGRSRFSRRACL